MINVNEVSFRKYRFRSRLLLFIGISIIVISPYLLTQSAIWDFFDFSTTGQIGDTIGGITAPFINLLAAVLIYLSFEQQIVANNIQRKALEVQINENKRSESYHILEAQFEEIKKEFYDLKYKRNFDISKIDHPELGKIYFGQEALEEYSQDITLYMDDIHLDVVNFEYSLKYIFLLIETFEERLAQSTLTKNDKTYLAKKFVFLYSAKMKFEIQSINRGSKYIEGKREEFAQINDESYQIGEIINSMFEKYNMDEEDYDI
ncbi:MAG: hypothetical protein JEZ09_20510 [Salinivirgaceae bacterium]|nr:hypothetical protein [Salinivirgaceae bacterium]